MSEKEKCNQEENREQVILFLGRLVEFNSALKLYHWHVIGRASYAQHIAIDQALTELRDYTDSIAEISYAMYDTLDIIVPKSKCPDSIVDYVKEQVDFIEGSRPLFCQVFIQSMLDDFQKTLEQLMYRLKRLS